MWDQETAERYDSASQDMFSRGGARPSRSTCSRSSPETGPLMEFAVGTGRVAIPLAARGLAVSASTSRRR